AHPAQSTDPAVLGGDRLQRRYAHTLPQRNIERGSLLKHQRASEERGRLGGPVFWADGPPGKESNWVQTVTDKFWFPYFRLSAPTQAYFDRIWPLPDIEKVP